MTENPKVVIVDVDKTLLDGSTNIILAKRVVRGFAAVKIIGKLAALALLSTTGRDVTSDMMKAGSSLFLGKREEELEREIDSAFDDLRGKIFRDMRRRIEEHRKAGARVWLAAPIPQQVIDRLAEELGADRAFGVVMIKDAQGRITERVAEPLCYRKGKRDIVLKALAEEGVDPKEARVYTDSPSDLPILEAVGQPVCANPSKELAAKAKERGWPVERFR